MIIPNIWKSKIHVPKPPTRLTISLPEAKPPAAWGSPHCTAFLAAAMGAASVAVALPGTLGALAGVATFTASRGGPGGGENHHFEWEKYGESSFFNGKTMESHYENLHSDWEH